MGSVENIVAMTREQFERRAESGPHCGLYREALAKGYPDFELSSGVHGVYWARLFPEGAVNDIEQKRCYLNESLLTALEHREPLIAFRALCQVNHYAGWLTARAEPPSIYERDKLLEARNRVEAWLSSVPVEWESSR